MPVPDFGPDYVDGQDATAEVFNDKFDLLRALLDADLTGLDEDNLQTEIIGDTHLTLALKTQLGISGSAKPAAAVTRTADATTTQGVATALTFQSERTDTNAIWDVGAPTRLTCQTAGLYLITAQAQFALSSIARHDWVYIRKNGATFLGGDEDTHPSVAAQTVEPRLLTATALARLTVGDYVEAVVFTDLASNSIPKTDAYSPEFSMVLLGGVG